MVIYRTINAWWLKVTLSYFHYPHPEATTNRVIDYGVDKSGNSVVKLVGLNRFDIIIVLSYVYIVALILLFYFHYQIYYKIKRKKI